MGWIHIPTSAERHRKVAELSMHLQMDYLEKHRETHPLLRFSLPPSVPVVAFMKKQRH